MSFPLALKIMGAKWGFSWEIFFFNNFKRKGPNFGPKLAVEKLVDQKVAIHLMLSNFIIQNSLLSIPLPPARLYAFYKDLEQGRNNL